MSEPVLKKYMKTKSQGTLSKQLEDGKYLIEYTSGEGTLLPVLSLYWLLLACLLRESYVKGQTNSLLFMNSFLIFVSLITISVCCDSITIVVLYYNYIIAAAEVVKRSILKYMGHDMKVNFYTPDGNVEEPIVTSDNLQKAGQPL